MDSGVRWLAHAEWYDSVTFVRGLSALELGTRLGADPAIAPVFTTAREIQSLLGNPNVGIARLGEAEGWAFAVESGESQGTQKGVLRQLSCTGGQAVNLDPQVNHPPSMFSCAVDGEPVCSFGLGKESRRWGSNPDLLNPALEAAGLLLEDGSALQVGIQRRTQRVAMSLGVIGKYFGLSLPQALVEEGELATVVVSGNADLRAL